jgi:ATP-binding cassette subfamily B protein
MAEKHGKDAVPSLWRLLLFFRPQVQEHRALLAGSMVALFLEVLFRLLEPWPLKFVFDEVLHPGRHVRHALWPQLAGTDPTPLLTGAAVAWIGITGLRALASYWSTVGFARIGNRVLAQLRVRLYRHVQFLSLSFHSKAKSGDLMLRVISDVALLQDVAVTAFLPTLGKVLIVLCMLGLMSWLNWRLTILSVSVLPLLWLRTSRLTKQIQEVAVKQRKRQGSMAAAAAESIGGIKTVQALSLEEKFTQSFSRASEKDLRQDVRGKRLAASLGRSVDVLLAVSGALVLWYGARLVLRKELTSGDLLVFLAYLRYAYRPLQDFSKYTGRMAKASAAGARVLELMDHVPEVRDMPGAVAAPRLTGRFEFEDVQYSYEPDKPVLRDVNLSVAPGQYIAVVGPSGSGKSTLLGLVLRLYDPVQGRILADGQDLRQYRLESLRSQISVVLQDNYFFAASIRDNIGYGAPAATLQAIHDAAVLANAHSFIAELPEGYDTVLGERGVTLSHGQRQRLAIARAAARNAPLLVLDEPTAGLDRQNENFVFDSLRRLAQDRTTFLATHNLDHASQADLIAYVEGGRIVESGSHDQLLALGGRYASQYYAQQPVHTATGSSTAALVAQPTL